MPQLPLELDITVADRQSFGPSYVRPQDLPEDVARYWSGTLRLPPQPDWQGDFTDWSANPFSDGNWQFQHHTLRWLNPLRWAALAGDETARAEWLRVARSWHATNVPAGSAPSRYAWIDMADGNRALQLSLGAGLADTDDNWYVDLLVEHRDWLLDESHIVGKNHGLHQHAGLLVVGAVLKDQAAMQTAVRRMTDQFVTTFDVQGCNDEGSTAYHQMNIQWWSQTWRRVEAEGMDLPRTVESRLSAADEVLAHMGQPDGRLPQIGDAARGRVRRGLGEYSEFAATGGKQGRKPESSVKVLTGGYVFSRSGWGEDRPFPQESHMLLRHGRDVRSHSHSDRGSLHIFASGRPWLVDSGFHSYKGTDPINRYLHSHQAHNVAFLEGARHDDRARVELTRAEITTDAHDFIVMDHGYASTKLARRVIYLPGPDCWIVWDWALSQGDEPLMQHWLMDLGLSSSRDDRGFRLRDGRTGASLTMAWLGTMPRLRRHRAEEESLRGWIGARWKRLEASTLLRAEAPAAVDSWC